VQQFVSYLTASNSKSVGFTQCGVTEAASVFGVESFWVCDRSHIGIENELCCFVLFWGVLMLCE
jgi:hypothetical protein